MSKNRKILFSFTGAFFVGIFILLSLVNTCQRFEADLLLKFTTDTIAFLADREYRLTGTVESFGYEKLTQHGFCWSESRNPTTNDQATQLGIRDKKGTFESIISDLAHSTTFYVRSYVGTNAGTEYGEEKSFTTPSPSLPVIVTTTVDNISADSAQSGGNISDDGGAEVTARGVCWGTSVNPTAADSHTNDGSGTGNFNSTLSGLSCNTKYYIRAYAINEAGTGYGSEDNFNTLQCVSTIQPVAKFSANQTSITEGQSVQFSDQSTDVPTSWSWNFGDGGTDTSQNPSHIYSSAGTYTVSLTAANSNGSDTETKTNYISVSVAGSPPVAAFTGNQTSITEGQSVQFSDQSTNAPTSWSWDFGDGGTDNSQNPSHIYLSAGTYTVSLHATNSYGSDTETKTGYITVGKSPVVNFTSDQRSISEGQSVQFTDQSTNNPTSWIWNFGDGGTSTSQNPSHIYLSSGTYTVSLHATNSYGSNSLTSADYIIVEANTLEDYDGNTYTTVKIGSQTWMAENLKTTRYANGSPILKVTGTTDWDALDIFDKAYCWYTNSSSNRDIYGGLYTWTAAMNRAGSSSANPSGVQGVCPNGWHLPSDDEWKQLEMHLGMSQAESNNTGWRGTDEGNKLKEVGEAHWVYPNTGASNETGFYGLPGGFRTGSGVFGGFGEYGNWWNSSEQSNDNASYRNLRNSNPDIYRGYNPKNGGFSVRCVKD